VKSTGDLATFARRQPLGAAGAVIVIVLVAVAVFAPQIAPHNPVKPDVAKAGTYRKAAWVYDANPRRTGNWDYPLGTNSIGRDVYSRLVYGTRVSLIVGFIPMVFTLLIGVIIGLVAGFAGGWVDNLLMRFTDVVYAFPALLFFIIMQISFKETAFGKLLNGLVLLFVTLSIVNWTGVARLVRGQVLSLKETDYVRAARAMGGTTRHIVALHLVRNSLTPVIVTMTLGVPGAMFAEAGLSFLGLGIAPPQTSWGQMIGTYQQYIQTFWNLTVFPAIVLAVTMLAWVILGDALQDALDPSVRR